MWMIPTVLIVTFVAFWAVRSGTDPVQSYLRLNPRATPAQIARYREVNGLVGSVPEQYVRWLGHFVTGNWGRSIKGSRPVWPSLKDALANSILLGMFATSIGVTVGLGIGIRRPWGSTRSSTPSQPRALCWHLGATVRVGDPIQTVVAVFIKNWLHSRNRSAYSLGLPTRFRPAPVEVHDPPATVVAIQIIPNTADTCGIAARGGQSDTRTARAKGIPSAGSS
jgi:hypothetical protein